jgi:hypothetical protein
VCAGSRGNRPLAPGRILIDGHVVAPLPRTFTEQWTEQSGLAPDVVRALFLDWQLAGEVAPSWALRSHA